MGRERLAVLTAALLLFARGAQAEEARFSDRFFRGTSPGELPTAKVAVVGALYVGAVASISLGVASLIQAGAKADDAKSFKQAQAPGFCNDRASPSCASYRNLLDEQRSAQGTGLLLLGTGAVLGIGGALTAELWRNDAPARVTLDLAPHSLTLGVSGKF
jgi:hypothetical protein